MYALSIEMCEWKWVHAQCELHSGSCSSFDLRMPIVLLLFSQLVLFSSLSVGVSFCFKLCQITPKIAQFSEATKEHKNETKAQWKKSVVKTKSRSKQREKMKWNKCSTVQLKSILEIAVVVVVVNRTFFRFGSRSFKPHCYTFFYQCRERRRRFKWIATIIYRSASSHHSTHIFTNKYINRKNCLHGNEAWAADSFRSFLFHHFAHLRLFFSRGTESIQISCKCCVVFCHFSVWITEFAARVGYYYVEFGWCERETEIHSRFVWGNNFLANCDCFSLVSRFHTKGTPEKDDWVLPKNERMKNPCKPIKFYVFVLWNEMTARQQKYTKYEKWQFLVCE